MKNIVTEIVSWKFKPHVSLAEAKTATVGLNALLKPIDGFINRVVYYSELNQTWVDVVEWRDMPSALAAIKTVEAHPGFKHFPPMIDEKTVSLSHYQTITEFKP